MTEKCCLTKAISCMTSGKLLTVSDFKTYGLCVIWCGGDVSVGAGGKLCGVGLLSGFTCQTVPLALYSHFFQL